MTRALPTPRSAPSMPPREIDLAWRALGWRAACVAGALTGLAALLARAPARIASMRGAVAWLFVLALAAAGRRWIASSSRARAGGPGGAP